MIRLCLALPLATPALHAAELDADRQLANSLLAVSQSRMPKVNAAKSWVKIGLSKVSLMLFPERPDFAPVTFEQDYQSNNLNDRTPKRQFWSRENGRWKIIHETSI